MKRASGRSKASISRDIEYDENVFRQREAAIQASPALFRTATDLGIRRVRSPILKDMKLKPRHSKKYQFVWSLDPQANMRAARWWRVNYIQYHEGENNGIYKRTGETEKNTKVVGSANKTNGEVSIQVPERAGIYVFTRGRQIPSHARSQHPLIEDVAEKWRPILNERIGGLWQTVADPFEAVKNKIRKA